MRVVVDTNVLVSGIFWAGTPCKVLEAWASDTFAVCGSAEILEEYFEVIDRLSVRCGREDLARRWKVYLFDHIDMVEPIHSFNDCRDPDDAKFVECALAGNAAYIVSGDDDLLVLANIGGIEILTPAQFLKAVES